MKKTDLLKPGSARANDLIRLQRQINKREDTIESLRIAHRGTGNALKRECILQGADLLKSKSYLAHGQWLEWLRAHCSGISVRSAQNYMRVVAKMRSGNTQLAAHLEEAETLRDCLIICQQADETEKPRKEGKPPKSFPPWCEGRNKFAKAIDYVAKHCPIDKMPEEQKQIYRELLEPTARELFPERWLTILNVGHG